MASTTSELLLQVKSTGIDKATQDLDKMKNSANNAEMSVKTLTTTVQSAGSAASNAFNSSSINGQVSSITTSLNSLMSVFNNLGNVASGSVNNLSNSLDQALNRIRVLEQTVASTNAQLNSFTNAVNTGSSRLVGASQRGNVYVNTLRSMATAASAYLSVNFARGIIEEADSWGMMQSKLSLALGSMSQAKVIQQDLYNSSQSLRAPLEDMAKLYTRMSVPFQKLGKSSSETKVVVEAFSTALKLAGATGQEASSAMLQFSQSLNAGRLNGGEFNSVAEAAPNVLRAIEAELIRTGKGAELAGKGLKKLASDGKITTEVLIEALTRAAPQWKKDFETLPLTFDGALTRIKNAWQKAIGEAGQDTGFNVKLAESMKKLEEVIPKIARTIADAFIFIVDNASKFLTILEYITAAAIAAKLGSMATALFTLGRSILAAETAAKGLQLALTAVGATPVGLILGAIAIAGYKLYNVFTDLNKVTAQTIENQKAIANSDSYLTSLREETLEMMRQADAARAKIGLPAMYAKELQSLSLTYKEQTARIKETEAATQALMIAEKKIVDYKRNNKLDTDYYVPKRLKDELKSAQDRVAAIAKVNDDASIEAQKKADASAVAAAARRGEERQRMIADAKQAAKSVNQIAADARKEAYDKLKADMKAYDLPEETVTYRKIKIERDYQEALEKTKKLKETTEPFDLWKEYTDDAAKQAEKIAKEHQKTLDSLAEENVEAEKQLAILTRQLEDNESLKVSKAEQAVIDAEAALNASYRHGIFSDEVLLAEKRLKIAKDTLNVTEQIEARDNAKAQADKYENAYQAANKKIADGLYSAIGKGGESAFKKLIRDVKEWFARLVLSPIIEPIAAFGASIISPNAKSANSNPLDVLSNIGSAFSKLMNSTTTGLADVIGKAGSFFGSSFMTEVSAAMKFGGASGFTGAAATALNAMPYVTAAIAAFDGMKTINKGYQIGNLSNDVQTAILGIAPRLFGMQEKQMTGQTVTGTLGTDNLSRNVAWSQKGGLFRSDRSGVWSYNLANSTAIQDGKAYQDTASMASDKALLNQLNTAYTSLKQNTADLAKSLNLSADSIISRNDAINFSFGKDNAETSANITKAFETISNTIAKDLLKGFESLSQVGESSYQTLQRLANTMGSVNNIFEVLGYKLYDINEAGIKSADAMVALYGGLDKFQAVTKSYYDNFYKETEKTDKALKVVKDTLKALGVKEDITTREEYRALVEKNVKDGNDQLVKSLMELSSAFAAVVDWTQEVVKTVESDMTYVNEAMNFPSMDDSLENIKKSIKDIASEAERWYNIRKQSQDLQSSIDDLIGNPKKDPTIRMQKLWDSLSKDITAEQKLSIANELKDLVLSKYQVEKDTLTRLVDFGKQLRGYVESLSLGSLSPLTLTDKLIEARRQYETTLAKAKAGDVNAQSALQGKSETYLQLAQTAFASSADYISIFNQVSSSLDQLGIDSMTAGDRAVTIADGQLAELLKIKEFAANMEVVSNNYYNESISLLTEQARLFAELSNRMGSLEGLTPILSSLPAEIAAELADKLPKNNADFVTGLYAKYAAKSGAMIDLAGMKYWVDEVMKYGEAYVDRSFISAVNSTKNVVASAPSAPVTNSIVAELTTAMVDLKAEVTALREDQQAQTGAIINATVMSNVENANAIVEATQETTKEKWLNANSPELV